MRRRGGGLLVSMTELVTQRLVSSEEQREKWRKADRVVKEWKPFPEIHLPGASWFCLQVSSEWRKRDKTGDRQVTSPATPPMCRDKTMKQKAPMDELWCLQHLANQATAAAITQAANQYDRYEFTYNETCLILRKYLYISLLIILLIS